MNAGEAAVLQAMLLGFAVAAPIGPVGALCINRCAHEGFVLGFATGLGSATVHGSWVFLAALGSADGSLVAGNPTLARGALFLAAALLAWMGVRAFLRSRQVANASAGPRTTILAAAYASGVALTVSNPASALVLLSSTPAYAAPGEIASEHGAAGIALAAFAGSAIWWAALATGVATIRHRIDHAMLAAINRAASVLLIALAAGLAARACMSG